MCAAIDWHAKFIHFFSIFSDSTSHFVKNEAEVLRTMKVVSAALKAVFPASASIPVIPSIGNHDVFPDNSMSVEAASPDRRKWCSRLGNDPELGGVWIGRLNDSAAGVDASRYADGESSLPV